MADALVVLPVAELAELIREAVRSEFEVARPAPEPPALLDRTGLAKALACCPSTLDRLMRDGLPHIRIGDSPRFDVAQVRLWLANRSAPARVAGTRGRKTRENAGESAEIGANSCSEVPATGRKPAKSHAASNGAGGGR